MKDSVIESSKNTPGNPTRMITMLIESGSVGNQYESIP
jgi:hypothetical protein